MSELNGGFKIIYLCISVACRSIKWTLYHPETLSMSSSSAENFVNKDGTLWYSSPEPYF